MKQMHDIKQGDIVYLISDILELVKAARENGEHFQADLFLQTILDKVGKGGTLLIPTFNWGFCKGKTFNYKTTRGETGALGNVALKNDNFVRTQHPIYSFAVAGRLQKELFEINNEDSFGEGTIFDYLYLNNAKGLVIGLEPLEGLTMVHYIEQIVGVDYRYIKIFKGDYIDWRGEKSTREVSMYVRDLDIDPQENMTQMGMMLSKLNIVHTKLINGVTFTSMFLKPVCDIVRIDAAYNHSRNLYSFHN